MADLVKSVEYVDFTMVYNTTSGNVTLTKGQDTNYCVPFYTLRGQEDYQDCHYYDVWFTSSGTSYSGSVNFQRSTARGSSSSGDHDIACYVVEFEPTEMNVYQGTFDIASGATTSGITTTAFDPEHTGMYFTYRSSSSNRNFAPHAVRGRVTASGVIDFDRASSSGSIVGHYYAFEATNSGITVYHYSNSTTGTSYYTTMGDSAIELLEDISFYKGFVIGSYNSSDAIDGYNTRQCCRFLHRGEGVVAINRNSAIGTIQYAWQYIKFNDNKMHVLCPFNPGSFSDSTTSTNVYWTGTGRIAEDEDFRPDMDYSMPFMSCYGIGRSFNDTTSTNAEVFNRAVLTSSTIVNVTRASDSTYSTDFMVNVIDWKGIPGPATTGSGTTVPMDTDYSFVKSVQNGRQTIEDNVNVVKFTKDQDLDNCVVFTGVALSSDEYNQYSFLIDARINKELNLLTLYRYGFAASAIVDYSIVEFYPDQVRVQAGHSYELSYDTQNKDIDITTISGTDKAFMMFNFSSTTSSQYWNYHQIRGYISDTSTLSFERMYSNSLHGLSWYLVEDLGDNFRCRHRVSSTTYNCNFYSPEKHDEYQTFTFFSSYIDQDLQNPAYCNHRTYFDWQYQPVFADVNSGSGSYTFYFCMTVVYFIRNLDCRHVQGMTPSMAAGTETYTGTYTSFYFDNSENVTFYNASNMNVAKNTGSSSSAIDEVFFTGRITNYETHEYEITNVGANSTYTRWPGFKFISWDNTKSFSRDYELSTKTRGLIKSMQQISEDSGINTTYLTLTKKQDLAQCLPIIHYAIQNDDSDVKRAFPSIYRENYYNRFAIRTKWQPNGSFGKKIRGVILEFNEDRVRIQHNTILMANTGSEQVTLEEVDLDKTFVYFTTQNDASVDYSSRTLVAHQWIDSTTLEFTRPDSSNYLEVSYFVVECLDDSWTVEHWTNLFNSTGTSFGQSMAERKWEQTMFFASISVNYTGFSPAFCGFMAYPSYDEYCRLSKYSSTGTVVRASIDMVRFKSTEIKRTLAVYISTSSQTTSRTLKIPNDPLDLNRSFVYNPVMANVTYGEGTSSSNLDHMFWYYEIDSLTCYGYRADGVTTSCTSTPLVVEFPDFKKYYFEGHVKEEGTPVVRTVRGYRSSTGEMVDETTSANGTGYFLIETSYSDEHHIVAFDDPADPSYNSIIYDNVIPTVISGTFAYNEGWVTTSGLNIGVPLLRQ